MEKFIPEIHYVPVDFDPFEGTPIDRTVPSTEAQREVFIASQMGPEASCAYNESVSLELSGTLDVTGIETSIEQLVQRHEALRGCMSADGMRVVIQAHTDIPLKRIDLSDRSEQQQLDELDRIADADMTTTFDLVHGPLFRATLIQRSATSHLLRLTGHHVLVDGWSLGIMMADISKLYGHSALPEPVQFSEFALAVIDHAHSEEHTITERFWLDQFKSSTPRLDLPTDLPRPLMKTYNANRIDIELDPELTRKLKELATRSGASLVTTLLTCFEMLLHHITGQTDLVVGLPAAGQNDFDMKQLVGHCVNLLALRSGIDEDRPFVEHLKERRTALLDASDNQKYTFGTLVRKLNVRREAGRIPLVPAVFNVDMNMDDGVSFEGLTHRFISNPRKYENFELFLNATGNEKHLTLEWSYNTDLFLEETVRGWMKDLQGIIERAHAAPTQRIGTLISPPHVDVDAPLPPKVWNGGLSTYPHDAVDALFDRMCDRYPDHVAIELGSQRVTYAELRKLVDPLAAELVRCGLEHGEPVGLCFDKAIASQTAMLAILKAGGCYVPFDLSYPEERIRYMLDDAKPRFMLTHEHLLPQLPGCEDRAILLDPLGAAASGSFTGSAAPVRKHDTNSPAYILYTSGSTGNPKGVVVPHRGVVRLVRDQNYMQFSSDLVFLQMGNLCFDASTFEIWGALLNGARLVIQPQQKPTLSEIATVLRNHKVTSVLFPTGLFNMLVDEQLDALSGLKHLVTGGDVMSPIHARKALKALGTGVIVNAYGPTENSVIVTCHAVDDESQLSSTVPIGKPISNTEAYILDEAMRPVPIGATGELYAGGDGVALGYWQRPEMTNEKFIPDPFSGRPNAKLYRTGDLARWRSDGTIEFIGRADTQVKLRGFRIELGEIETAMDGIRSVKDRIVLCREDRPGDKQLVTYLVASDPRKPQEEFIEEIRAHLQRTLPPHMVPAAYVVLPEFPLNQSGKVDRKALPAPNVATPSLRAQHVAPRDATEKELAVIWSAVLGVEDIGVHDNFFDLGGHSLTGIQLLTKVEQRFGLAIEFKQLFVAPTVAQMAQLLAPSERPVAFEQLLSLRTTGSRVPLICIHGDEANVFLPKYLSKDQPFYAISHQGEAGKPIAHTEVETIAAYYISELKKVLPRGPYDLCGYSFGGLVAFEMARQLTASGDQVPAVILLDAYAPGPYLEVMREEQKFHEPAKKVVLRAVIAMYRAMDRPIPARIRNFHIIDTYDRAVARYRMTTYSGNVILIKANGSPGSDDMGWAPLVSGKLSLRNTVGDHYSMIKEPLVAQLAEEMEAAMAQGSTMPAAVV
ncbi:MAG: amino acid adenylation domain-containing protein [Flavobacteriales bacterium]|nr:amino acid adenylation domain-containing protein [Flavobacteriales bacterium]